MTLRGAITGIGAAVPEKVMTNLDFEKILDTSDEWITKRTGIKERRLVSDGETTASLSVSAARKALENAGVDPKQLDLVICATVSPDMILPASGCLVQKEIGASDVPAFDISAACSGFVYGLSVANQFIATGTYKRILVIAADTLTRFSDYSDRGSCVLFGDAAGAVVLEPADREGKGIQYTVMHADGGGWDFIHVPAGGSKHPASKETVEKKLHYVKMRGRDVYKFAVEKMQWLMGDCMEKCGLSVDDVDMVLPHQVNIRIIKSARYGNTSGASIPLALDEAYRDGKIGPGSTIMMIAFGAGLTWAGAVVRL
jgi:3-oxoacyl-[acyl-carrier-protein] synthase-3